MSTSGQRDAGELGTQMAIDDILDTPPSIDHAAIFAIILARQALRIEARLPRLDVAEEYRRAVAQALWRHHVDRHHDRVRVEILAQQRARHGSSWGMSWGGRMALSILTRRALEESFRKP